MGAHPVTHLPEFLRGRWTVLREIVPLRGAPSGGFEGEARFDPPRDASQDAPSELVYVERGDVWIGDHHGEAARELRYRHVDDRARIHFADGRYFHDLDLRHGIWRADHPCGEDLYQGRFRVLGPDEWEQVWDVTGPSADYRIHTRLTRRGL